MSTPWDVLITALTDVIGRLPEGGVLQLLEVARLDGGYYAQLVQDADVLHAEVSGSRSVDPDRRLSADRESGIGSPGWQPPDTKHPANWWIDLDWPAAAAGYQGLATAIVDVFRGVFGLGSPAELTYRAWLTDTGEDISLPELALDTLVVKHFVRLGPGDTPQLPKGLLRRTRIGGRIIDEALGRTGQWQPTETLALAELGELDDEVVSVREADASAVVESWRWLADGGQAAEDIEPTLRLAGAVDADPDRDGRPIVRGPGLVGEERAAVATYLREAPIVVAAYGFDPDPFDPDRPEVVPLHLHTDGLWVWSESLAYFAARYGIAPEPDLLTHIRRQGYRWPEVDRAVLDRAARLVMG